MTETWNFINTGSKDPYYNMAMDEALLNFVSRGEIDPVIRFYTWNPATLSIGYFQRLQKEIDIDKVKEAYRVISQGLLEGFKNLGFDTYFAVPKTPEERQKLKQPRSSVCFDAPSWYELVVEGRKIAGSAQTRQKGVILQHGSILQDIDIDELFDMFIYKNERLKLKMKEAFVEKAVAINDISDEHITISQMEEAFEKGFKKGLNIELKPLELTEAQLAEVEELTEKYRSDEWMFRK